MPAAVGGDVVEGRAESVESSAKSGDKLIKLDRYSYSKVLEPTHKCRIRDL